MVLKRSKCPENERNKIGTLSGNKMKMFGTMRIFGDHLECMKCASFEAKASLNSPERAAFGHGMRWWVLKYSASFRYLMKLFFASESSYQSKPANAFCPLYIFVFLIVFSSQEQIPMGLFLFLKIHLELLNSPSSTFGSMGGSEGDMNNCGMQDLVHIFKLYWYWSRRLLFLRL